MIRSIRGWGTDDVDVDARPAQVPAAPVPAGPPGWAVGVVAAVAALARLVYLFGFAPLQNAGEGHTDAYHHWQIGYLTQQIGLGHGPRLWDLKGQEYFWGTLHPLLLSVLFTFTGHDIIVPRLLSAAFGTLIVALVFLLAHRYFGLGAAIGAAAFAALSPLAIFSDTAGLTDPLGAALCLLGVWLAPRRQFLAGLVLALAATARAEAWVFGGLIVLLLYWARPALSGRGRVLRGWLTGMAAYLLFLWGQTGNPIYPFYWNYLVSASGHGLPTTITAAQQAIRPLFVAGALVLGAAFAAVLARRPAVTPLLGYALASGGAVCALFAFTSFITQWDGWVWRDRVIAYPLELVVTVGLGGLFAGLARLGGRARHVLPLAAGLGLALATQSLWPNLQSTYHATDSLYALAVQAGTQIGAASRAGGGGVVMVPDDRPTVTYTMVTDGAVPATEIQSQHYDPLFYLPAGSAPRSDPARMAVVWRCWIHDSHTRLLVIDTTHPDYAALVRDHADWFSEVGEVPQYNWVLYRVHAPAAPSAAECAAAAALAG